MHVRQVMHGQLADAIVRVLYYLLINLLPFHLTNWCGLFVNSVKGDEYFLLANKKVALFLNIFLQKQNLYNHHNYNFTMNSNKCVTYKIFCLLINNYILYRITFTFNTIGRRHTYILYPLLKIIIYGNVNIPSIFWQISASQKNIEKLAYKLVNLVQLMLFY